MKDLESSQDVVHINYFMNTFIEYFSIFLFELLLKCDRVVERVSKYECILEYIACHPRSNHNQINFIEVLTLFIFHMLKYIFLPLSKTHALNTNLILHFLHTINHILA